MSIRIFTILGLIAVLTITGCGGGGHDLVIPPPGKATLTFPAQNAVCTTGTVLSDTLSAITFSWTASSNTDSYEVDVKNLLTSTATTQTIITNQITINLLRNTPYSWEVISKSSNSSITTQSDVWKFYNSGLGVTSHPPFPADLILPSFGQTLTGITVNLTWTGSDADNDIAGYDVYFGTTNTPPILKSNVTDMFLNNVTITSGNTYYWKVVTKDLQGNTSDSGVFQFNAN